MHVYFQVLTYSPLHVDFPPFFLLFISIFAHPSPSKYSARPAAYTAQERKLKDKTKKWRQPSTQNPSNRTPSSTTPGLQTTGFCLPLLLLLQ